MFAGRIFQQNLLSSSYIQAIINFPFHKFYQIISQTIKSIKIVRFQADCFILNILLNIATKIPVKNAEIIVPSLNP